jgi:hypothetical protein
MQFRVGNATITKIPELVLEVLTPTDLMPHEDPERVRQLTSSLSDIDVDRAKYTSGAGGCSGSPRPASANIEATFASSPRASAALLEQPAAAAKLVFDFFDQLGIR